MCRQVTEKASMAIIKKGWLRRLREGVRQKAVGVLQRSGMGFSPERSGGSWSDVVRSEQRNDKPREGWHRSVSGLSFRRGVLTTSRKDKPMQRARSYGRGGH